MTENKKFKEKETEKKPREKRPLNSLFDVFKSTPGFQEMIGKLKGDKRNNGRQHSKTDKNQRRSKTV